jgi:NADPH:quinone reductase-like Zn-dependent oxidoreductase
VQLGKAAGAHVTATVRNLDHRDAVAQLGADAVLDPEDFRTHGPYDVILELVGAPNMPGNLEALATDGRIAIIGVGAGNSVELSLLALMGKRARIMGSTLRARPLEEKAVTARRLERSVLPHFETGALTVPVAYAFALDEVHDAYERCRRRQAGKDRATDMNTVERLFRALERRDWDAVAASSSRRRSSSTPRRGAPSAQTST